MPLLQKELRYYSVIKITYIVLNKKIVIIPKTFVFSMSRGYRNGSIDMYAFMHKRVDPLGSNCIN